VRQSSLLLVKQQHLDKKYFTFEGSLKDLPTCEDNASCILMSENPTNRERSRHMDVRVHFLRDMVRDGSVKLIKCAGTQNVADALTKSLPRPAFHKHREFLKGTAQSFSAFLLAPTSQLSLGLLGGSHGLWDSFSSRA
jgi:hypothetical protein